MSATGGSVIKEYLISVGVKADTGALSKFSKILFDIEKLASSLTTAMGAAVAGIETLVTVATNNLDDLYWATKRLKSSASDIQDFQLRMSKAGESAQDARDSLEALQAFRRTNPFADSLLGLFGVQSKGKGAVQTMDALIVRFKQLNQQGQYWLAVKWGEQIGLDERQVWSMVQTSSKAEDLYANMYKKLGINQKQALQNAHDYTNKLKDFNAELHVVEQTLGLKFLPVADKFLTWLTTSEASHNLGTMLLNIAEDFGKLADKAAGLLSSLPPEAQEIGIIGLFLFGKKAAIVFAMLALAGRLMERATGGPAAVQQRQQDQIKQQDKNAKAVHDAVNSPAAQRAAAAIAKDAAKLGEFVPAPVKKFLGGIWGSITGSVPAKTAGDAVSALGNLLGSGEGGYNSVNLGKRGGYHSATADLGNMTIAQVMAAQKRGDFNAAGKYQMLPGTLSDAAKALHLDGKTKFDQGTQDRIFKDYLLKSKRKEISDYLSGRSNNLKAAVKAAAKEWASVADPDTGKSYYDGIGGNKATISSAQVAQALQSARSSSGPLGAGGAGGKGVTLNQTNNTTIHNAKDPAGTGAQVKKVNDRTNGDLVRNLSTALI